MSFNYKSLDFKTAMIHSNNLSTDVKLEH